jgi:hypothetical protein
MWTGERRKGCSPSRRAMGEGRDFVVAALVDGWLKGDLWD